MSAMLPKIAETKNLIAGRKISLEVDGGINPDTAKFCVEHGANVLVAGSAIFKSDAPEKVIQKLHQLGEN